MTDKEKYELLQSEINKKYDEYFEEEQNQHFKDEFECIKFSEKFHKELKEFIEKRKKELGIKDSTQK